MKYFGTVCLETCTFKHHFISIPAQYNLAGEGPRLRNPIITSIALPYTHPVISFDFSFSWVQTATGFLPPFITF